MVNNDRRSDIGSKMVVAVLSALISIIMTITWFTARDAMAIGINNKVDIAIQYQQQTSSTKLLEEVRDDVKLILRSNGHKV